MLASAISTTGNAPNQSLEAYELFANIVHEGEPNKGIGQISNFKSEFG